MDEHTRGDLRIAHSWASRLADDETKDRTLILEGLLAMIKDIIEGDPVDIVKINNRYNSV